MEGDSEWREPPVNTIRRVPPVCNCRGRDRAVSNDRLAELIDERRPKRADAARNYDALIDAARNSFAEDGVESSLEAIARRAGVGIGTLYRNFPTRDSLIEAVYLEEVAGVAAYADEVSSREPFDAFAAWLHRFAEYASTKKVLIEGLNRESPLLQSCRFIIYESGEPLLKKAQGESQLRPDITIDDAVRLVSGVAGVAFPDAGQRARVIDLAIDGLRSR
jgi:AcrR family transcriptional regulator